MTPLRLSVGLRGGGVTAVNTLRSHLHLTLTTRAIWAPCLVQARRLAPQLFRISSLKLFDVGWETVGTLRDSDDAHVSGTSRGPQGPFYDADYRS